MKKFEEREQIKIPKGMFCSDRDCRRCLYAERDRGSNSGWYCIKKSTHVRPGVDECGYFKD